MELIVSIFHQGAHWQHIRHEMGFGGVWIQRADHVGNNCMYADCVVSIVWCFLKCSRTANSDPTLCSVALVFGGCSFPYGYL
jgi:hypothetical protein